MAFGNGLEETSTLLGGLARRPGVKCLGLICLKGLKTGDLTDPAVGQFVLVALSHSKVTSSNP